MLVRQIWFWEYNDENSARRAFEKSSDPVSIDLTGLNEGYNRIILEGWIKRLYVTLQGSSSGHEVSLTTFRKLV